VKFADPAWLFLGLLIPLILWLRYYHRRRPYLSYSSTRDIAALPASWRQRAAPVLPFLYAAALLALCLGAARPQRPLGMKVVRTRAVDIVLVIDTSTSMRAEDMGRHGARLSRLAAAKEVAQDFVARRPYDRIALIAFAAMPYTMSPLTLDHDWLLQRIESLRTGMLEDATAIGDAIGSALNRLRDSKAKSRIVILLTDGVNNAGVLDPRRAAAMARTLGIKVYTVGVGSRGWAPYPVTDAWGNVRYVPQPVEIDEDLLQDIASTTGGLYFRATDFDAMKQAYKEIDRLEKTEIQTKYYTRYEELYPWFLGTGLVFLVLERLLSATVLMRVP